MKLLMILRSMQQCCFVRKDSGNYVNDARHMLIVIISNTGI